MSGIVFDIKRFAIHDGPGTRTSIFFKGCPLKCWWCHNPESCPTGIQELDFEFKGSKTLGWETNSAHLLAEVEKDRMFYDESGGGITFTGGEPLIQADFFKETVSLFKKNDLHITLDTTAFASAKVFTECIELVDLLLVDIKQMDELKHIEYTGVSNQPIFRNLELAVEMGKEIYIRFPMIPGFNDDEENIEKMMAYLLNLKTIKQIHILPYHRIAEGKYKSLNIENKMIGVEEPSDERVQYVKNKFEKQGFNAVIG